MILIAALVLLIAPTTHAQFNNTPLVSTSQGGIISATYGYFRYVSTTSGGSTSPGGTNTNIQFNNNGAFGGAGSLTWNSATSVLTVSGSAKVGGPSSGVGHLAFQQGDGTHSGYTDYLLSDGSSLGYVGWGVTGTLPISTRPGTDLTLSTNNAERMRITNAGNVGIGTSSPNAKLDVNGQISATSVYLRGATGGDFGIAMQSATTPYMRLGMDTSYQQYIANNAYWDGTQYNVVSAGGYGGHASAIRQASGNIYLSYGSSATLPSGGTGGWANRLTITGSTGAVSIPGALTVGSISGDGSGLTGITGDNLGNHTATQDLSMGANQVTFSNAAADKLYLYSNTYGLGIESSTFTNWSGSQFRWRIGGTSASTGTQYMLLTNAGLTVTGAVDASTQFLGQANDTASAPSFSWSGDTNAGMFRPLPDGIGFATGGAERLRITSAISTTAGTLYMTQASTGTSNIEMGSGRSGNGYSYIDLVGDATYTDYGLRLIRGNAGANTNSQLLHRGTGSLDIWAADSGGYVRIGASGAEAMRIANNGYVGIGSTSPDSNLDVSGSVITTGAVNGVVVADRTGNGSSSVFYRSNNYTSLYDNTAGNVLTYDTTGKIGIGTTSPNALLNLKGFVGSYSEARFNNSTNGSAYGFRLSGYGSNGRTVETGYIDFQTSNGTTNSEGMDLVFGTASGGSLAERMRITAAGNVGIGATPAYPLDVNGGIRATQLGLNGGAPGGGSAGLYVKANASYPNGIYSVAGAAANAGVIGGSQNGASAGYLGYNNTWGVYCATNSSCGGTAAWSNTSDARLKERVKDLSDKDGLAAILKLRPVTFHWKDVSIDKNQGQQLGFLAQDVQKVLPVLIPAARVSTTVHLANSRTVIISDSMTLSYATLVVPLVKAVQE